MEKVRIDDIEPGIAAATLRRSVTEALDAKHVSINYYELAPGDSFAFGYHRHELQEEVFIILEGEVTFETEEGEVTVGAGEIIRFGPGEYQQGVNTGEERVSAYALGAPQERGDSELLRACSACGERTQHTIEWVEGEDAKRTRCLACGEETGRFT